MNQQDAGRLAIGVILGVVGAVAIIKSGLSQEESILRWLIFVFVTGLLANTQEGKKFPFLLGAAVLAAFGLIITLLWIALLGNGVIPGLSAVSIDLVNNLPFASAFLGGIWFLSVVAIVVSAYARPMALKLFHDVFSLELETAKKIEALLKVLVSIAGTLALVVFSIT